MKFEHFELQVLSLDFHDNRSILQRIQFSIFIIFLTHLLYFYLSFLLFSYRREHSQSRLCSMYMFRGKQIKVYYFIYLIYSYPFSYLTKKNCFWFYLNIVFIVKGLKKKFFFCIYRTGVRTRASWLNFRATTQAPTRTVTVPELITLLYENGFKRKKFFKLNRVNFVQHLLMLSKVIKKFIASML